jgi:hypothetical protein
MRLWKRDTDTSELREYLLGILPGPQQEQLEKRVLTDSEFYEQLLASEDELVDEYLSNSLNERERRQFESHFGASKDRRQKIHFGQSLRTYLQSRTDPQVETVSLKSPGVFAGFWWQRKAIAVSLFIAVAFGVLAVFLLSQKRSGQLAPQGQVAVVTLVPGSVRSEGALQRVAQPRGNGSVQIKLELGTNEYQTYRVALFREDELITTFEPVRAQNEGGHFVLPVTVESSRLEPGDYRLKVEGISVSGQTEFKDQYRFRLVP